jgi:hypothetical protein
MLSKLLRIAVLTFSVGVLLAQAAHAKTFNGTFTSRGTTVSIGGSFSFDGSTTSTAALSTGRGTSVFPTKLILGGAFDGQVVNEVSVGTISCSFTGVFGESETGVTTTLVGSASAADGPLGALFYVGTSGSGCVSLTTGAFTFTETDAILTGTGIYKNAGGNSTYTSVGFTLAPPVVKGAFGFFQWARAKGTITLTLP